MKTETKKASVATMLVVKLQHSYFVGEICSELCRSLGWDDDKITIATLMGFVHDIGSVDEIARMGKWEHEIDHGLRGYQLLMGSSLRTVWDGYQDVALGAVLDHSKVELRRPNDEFLRVLRDADKLAILCLVNELIDEDKLGSFCKSFFRDGTTPVTLCDKILGWVNDINYDWTRERIRDLDTVAKLREVIENEQESE